jgi:hypothetical protein
MVRAPGPATTPISLWCIRDDIVTGWHNNVKGARALAVAGCRVALFGGYGPDHDRLALTELDADPMSPIQPEPTSAGRWPMSDH